MAFDDLRQFVLDTNFDLQGVEATVTTAGDDPIATSVIWMTDTSSAMPGGMELQRNEPYRVMALKRSAVPRAPIGTLIVAPERPGIESRTWRVDGYQGIRADMHHVVVVPHG